VAVYKSRKDRFPSYEDFMESVRGKKFAPVYLFIGEEDFLIEQCLDKITGELLNSETKAFNLDVVYGSRVETKDVLAHAASFPMMSERRVVIVREFEKMMSGEPDRERISAYSARPLESTCLVLVTENPDFRTKPFTDLKKTGKVFAFNPLYDNQVPAWIVDWCSGKGIDIDGEAARLVHGYVGNSLRSITNELNKLFIYLKDRKVITVEDVADVIGVTRGYTVFDLQNSIGKKEIGDALRIVKRMIETGEQPQMVIVMLTRYFNILWKVQDMIQRGLSEDHIAAAARISPYYLKDYIKAAKLFSMEQVEGAFEKLLQSDLQLKTVSPDPYHLMEMLVYSLVRGSGPDNPATI
jgi:DNA polymerase-3 subunit delta